VGRECRFSFFFWGACVDVPDMCSVFAFKLAFFHTNDEVISAIFLKVWLGAAVMGQLDSKRWSWILKPEGLKSTRENHGSNQGSRQLDLGACCARELH
jgi:hypothetical protein